MDGQELPCHINLKEILAAQFNLETLMKNGDIVNHHMDNRVAVSFVNKMGGTRSRVLCTAVIDLWKLVLSRLDEVGPVDNRPSTD